MRSGWIATLAIGVALTSTAASGQMAGAPPSAAPACPAIAAPLPATLAGWAEATSVTAAATRTEIGGARLTPGRRADVALRPGAAVLYPVPPGKTGDGGSQGGVLRFTIAEAGTYRVALSAGAWIEVVRDGRSVASTAHAHGPACSGIRKTVDFVLTPGAHMIEIAAGTAPTIGVMVVRLP